MTKRSDTDRPGDPGAANEEQTPAGKGRPTPRRKEAQAAKARPLVANRHDKAAVREQRLKEREARERARVGMMKGDERFLTARDRGPQRRWIRDYVDARFSIGEFMIPAMGVVLLMTFIPLEAFQIGSLVAIWIFVIFAVGDSIILGVRITKKLEEKFGTGNVQSGTKFYAAMRSLQMRVLRVPKPQVKRGQYPN